ncbi:hypothetical protein A2W14_05895 [Candidatus Gottesmanbacteria bacterium RBG_16_37_8]|uniref:GIY-YIG domain-containing protein n=1 Tax=Candidatus Gottesmanbacteria bacterium RBG_16_37_8 TaxID=1798371 RepID=A0A1F5YV39_9BACT|nr:MAG: hypothetical protein A2W14_05895 [Candidatus Gottesmanbacteria bacterium RBG_16_37_8]
MYTVYIIQNDITKKYYIGITSNIDDRLRHHNSGASKSTCRIGIWKVIHHEYFENKKDAWLREKRIKSYKGGNAFKKLISGRVA